MRKGSGWLLLAMMMVAGTSSLATVEAAETRSAPTHFAASASVGLKYSCPNWKQWTFPNITSAMAFHDQLKRYGFQLQIHAGPGAGQYTIHYRLSTPGSMRYHTRNAREQAARQLQWFVGYGINVVTFQP